MPKGWKPTAAEPIPPIRCVQIKRNGEQCNRWSLRGATKCYTHNGHGNFPNANKYAEAVVEAARLRLVGIADEAVDIVHDLALNSTADNVRLKAATEILDRAGVKGPVEVDVQVTHNEGESAAERTRRHLQEIAERTQAAQDAADEKRERAARDIAENAARLSETLGADDDIVDAEVVED